MQVACSTCCYCCLQNSPIFFCVSHLQWEGKGMPSRFSRVWLYAPLWTVAHQAFLSMGFSRQEYWSGLPCPPPGGNLPNPGMEPASLSSSALAGRFFTTSATWWLIFTLVTRDGRINLYIESQIFTSSIYSPCLKLDFPWIQRFLHALVCKGYRNKLPQSEWQ